uniref:Putative reverse transcriptase domain-containing protein n=1 Tax=Tanacetum cinerariifolium TaxID=118510 RepID=A0A6L2NAF4_TANCI|nr:putative reverse transcriptase domain-containing protein [Tanacetum cinerariifolium]
MRTRSAGRATAAPRGGRIGGRTGRGGGKTRGRSGDPGSGRIDGQGGQVGGQGSEVNDDVDGVLDFSTIIPQKLHNLLPTILAQVGNQGSNQGNSRNRNGDAINEIIQGDVRNVLVNNNYKGCTYKELFACNPKEYDGKGGAIVYTRWIEKMKSVQDMSRCEENQQVKYTTGSFVGKALTWWNSQFWNHAMVGASHAGYNDRFHELARLVPHLVTHENNRIQRNGSLKKNPENRGNGEEPNKDRNVRNKNKRTRTKNAFATTTNPVRREYNFIIPKCGVYAKVEEAHQDPNIVTVMFNLNDHYATTLFDSGADYSFVSTTFIPLLCIEPNKLGFSYEIEIASRKLVEIDKVIRGCKLKIEAHMFEINLIPFGSGSFDVIIGMDWFSNHKAAIICHEKAKEQKQEEIVMVRDFPEVFSDDLSGLPPIREIEFRIDLILGAIPVAKSPYRLTRSEMEELTWKEHEMNLGLVLELLREHKSKTFDWGEEQERVSQTLKDKLYNAHVLALPDRPKDFVVYCDASGLGLVADALSRKKRIKPKRIRAMNMTHPAVFPPMSGCDTYVRELSMLVAYNRCDTLKGSIQGNKSVSCRHRWKQPDYANCFWHAAIALAVENEFALAFHVVCCRHLMMNLSLLRKKMKGLFWKICKAYTTEEFSTEMSNLHDVQPDAYHKLCEAGPQRWSRVHFPLKLPVLKLAETYRAMVQDWYSKRRELADGRYDREVDFQTRTSQCRKWQLFEISCGHVIAVTRFTSPPERKFVGGMVATVDPVELDTIK